MDTSHPSKKALWEWFCRTSDEEAPPDSEGIEAHVAACVSCQEYGGTISAFREGIKGLKREDLDPRTQCPDSWTFVRYAEGQLQNPVTREYINSHIAFCPDCFEELIHLRAKPFSWDILHNVEHARRPVFFATGIGRKKLAIGPNRYDLDLTWEAPNALLGEDGCLRCRIRASWVTTPSPLKINVMLAGQIPEPSPGASAELTEDKTVVGNYETTPQGNGEVVVKMKFRAIYILRFEFEHWPERRLLFSPFQHVSDVEVQRPSEAKDARRSRA
jgi:hypothetical protein